jgi:hypothetical protein
MGQQQIILITLCVIIVGTAIAVGLIMFQASAVAASKDALISNLLNIAGDARAYYARSKAVGGGGRSFVGYQISKRMASNQNGTFDLDGKVPTNTTVYFKAISVENPDNWIRARLDISTQKLSHLEYSPGDFEE